MNLQVGKSFLNTIPSSQPALIEITQETLPFLEKVLHHAGKTDPFAKSAGYYAMTGRKGLWLYGDNDTTMVIAQHPNKDNTVLFFPPFGRDAFGLIQIALNDPQIPEGEIQIARVGQDETNLSLKLQAVGISPPQAEDVLDWTYPVHLVSTEKVIEHKGGAFNNFRAHLNQAFRAGYKASQLDPDIHADAVVEIVDRWAKDGKKAEYTYGDLTSPTTSLLSLMKSRILHLEGVIVFEEEKPVGFWIWDEGDKAGKTAMSLARVSIGNRGASEFAGLKMAEILKERGFDTICLGGSETESLDKFKRKLVPVNSISLKTMHI